MTNTAHTQPCILTTCIALALLNTSPVQAECIPSGTPGDDTIVCIGTDTDGVTSGDGDDTISVESGASVRRDDTIVGVFFDDDLTAIDTGGGDDTVANHGTVGIDADAWALGPEVAPGKAELTTLGIVTGSGTNIVENHSVLDIDGSATTVAGGAWFGKGYLPLLASATATTDSTGMRGGDGTDTLSNLAAGSMTITAMSDATMFDLSLTSTGLSLSMDILWDGGTSATATAVGMNGLAGDDHLLNAGTQVVTADSTARSATVTGTHEGLAVSINSTQSSATATGLSGGNGVDTIDSIGVLTVTSNAWAGALDLSGLTSTKDAKGVVKSFMGTSADAIATGIDAGSGGGRITTAGSLVVTATSQAYGISASWTPETNNDAPETNDDGWVDWVDTLASPWLEEGLDFIFGFESGTTATATATGIAGGDGADWINNSAAMEIDASSTSFQLDLSVDAGKLSKKKWADLGQSLAGVLSEGAKLLLITEGGAQPTTTATAIQGGAGTDNIVNQGNIRLDSNASATSVTVSLANEALDLEFITAVFEGGTSSAAAAYGITGDSGADTITNLAGGRIDAGAHSFANADGVSGAFKGLTQTVVTSDATATATGVDGGGEDDTLENYGEILVDAESEAVSVGLSVNLDGGALALDAIFDGGTKAESTATGMFGDDGVDTLRNFGRIEVGKEVETDSTARSTGAAGALNVAVAAVTSTATTTFAGIDGGEGDDTLENEAAGEIAVDATADAASWGVSVSGTGVALALDAVWDGGTKATASARGIAGGDGSDELGNDGTVDIKSTADVDSNGIALTASGVAGAVVTSSASATSVGLEGGKGDDTLDNHGEIMADAQSDATSTSVALAGSGVALAMDAVWDGGTHATSTATGMSGDKGIDTLHNFGTIEVGRRVDTDATARSVGVAGVFNIESLNVAASVVTSTATSTFAGIAGGEGDDNLTNETGAAILVDAKSDAASTSVAFTGTGVALALDAVWDGGTRAFATGYGLSGGEGVDFLSNLGTADITSTAVTRSTGVSVSGVGVAGAVVASTATAEAAGMDAAAGADTLYNGTAADLTAKADARASSTGVALTLTGASAAYAGTEATADAWGMSGGAGQDTITNDGSIATIGLADATSTGVSGNIYGLAAAFAGAVANARPTGMSGGGDSDTLTNTGNIDVKAKSSVDASSLSFNLNGVAYSKVAESTADVLAIGIDGGAGDDTLTNTGLITIGLAEDTEPMAKAYARSASWNLVGAALSDAVLSATPQAVGIEGGDGDDWIFNTGTILVGPGPGGPAMAYGDVSGSSWTFLDGANTDATATVTSESTGLSGGTGTDSIRNEGTITVNSYADLLAENGAKATFGGSSSSATTTASAIARGMDGGSEDSLLINSGALAIYAHANNTASNNSNTGFLYGNGDATTNADATVNAYGMVAMDGTNTVANMQGHAIQVTATSLADAYSYSDGGDIWNGDASSTTTATVTSDSAGIVVGNGHNTVVNDGAVTVSTHKAVGDTAMAYAVSDADGDGLDGDGSGQATATVTATLAGIRAGSGTNVISNAGSINVTAEPTSFAKVNIDGDNSGNATGNTYSTASAEAVGIDSGDGYSLIINSGTLAVTATAVADTSRSVAEGWLGSAYGGRSATATATAVGIRSGNGNHVITNTGSITVSAETGSNFSGATLSTTATGIQTGTGDDTVATSGTIRVTTAGAVGRTLAIDTGEGNDHVSLLTGSDTAQDIELGEGQDTLLLAAGAAFTGVARADPATPTDPDIDTFVLGGDGAAGSFDLAEIGAAARYRGFDAFRKQGLSTWTLTGDKTIDWIVDEGRLAIAGELTGTVQNDDASSGAVIDVLAGAQVRGFDLFTPVVLDGTGALINRGVIESAFVEGNRVGVLARGNGNYIFNAGEITVHGPDANRSTGIFLNGTDALVRNEGVVRANGPMGSAIVLAGDGGVVVNYGLLTSAGPVVSFESEAGTDNTLINHVGGVVDSSGTLAIAGGAGNDSIENYGDILGDVTGSTGDDQLANFNLIHGSVDMGPGDDTVRNYGELFGAVDLNDGNDSLVNQGRMQGGGATGAGDDQVTNYGEIHATAGVALDLGDGADRLTIAAPSLIDGTADGGADADTFVLGGGENGAFDLDAIGSTYIDFEQFRKENTSRWVLTGSAAGPWTLADGTLIVNGSLLGDALVESPGRLGGTGSIGSLVNHGTVAPGNSIGVLSVTGDYEHGPDAVLEIEIDGAGHADRLDVGGTATLQGGTVQVVPQGPFGIATEYSILEADGGVDGRFASLFSTLDFLDPELDYQPDRVMLTVIRNDFSFASFGETLNQLAVGTALDAKKKAAARGDFKPAMDEFLSLTADEIPAALDALDGELHATTQSSLLRGGDAFLTTAIDRPLSAWQKADGNRAAWVDGFGAYGSPDSDGNAHGADYRTAGVATGLDVAVGASTRIGLAMGFSNGSTDLQQSGGDNADVNSLHVALYGAYEDGPWNLRSAVAYSRHDVDAKRTIGYGDVDRVARSSYDASQYSAYVRGRGSIAFATDASLQPFATLAWSQLDRARFTESGADSLDLAVKSETTDSLYSVLGLRAVWDRTWQYGLLRPELSAGWMHQYLDDHGEITASLAGAAPSDGNESFSIRGVTNPRNGLLAGAGLVADMGESSRAFLNYNLVYDSGNSDQAIVAGVRVNW